LPARVLAGIFLCLGIWIFLANPFFAYFIGTVMGAADCGYVGHVVWNSMCRHTNWVVALLTPVMSLALSGAIAAFIVKPR